MKKYRLKKLYPTLPKWAKEGDIFYYDKIVNRYGRENDTVHLLLDFITVEEVEGFPEFWEEVKEKDKEITTTPAKIADKISTYSLGRRIPIDVIELEKFIIKAILNE